MIKINPLKTLAPYDLRPSEKLIATEILMLKYLYGVELISSKMLAEKSGYTVRTITRNIKHLETKGAFKIVKVLNDNKALCNTFEFLGEVQVYDE